MSKNQKLSIILALAVLVVGGAVIRSITGGKQEPQVYKIGGVFTLTGGTAYWSEELQKGMEIALEEENKSGGIPIRGVYEDVQAKPQMAVSAFQKLNEVDKVSVAVSVFTPISQPLRPVADRVKLPLLATITSVRDFAKGYTWSFRDFMTQEQMAGPMGVYAVTKLGLKTAAALVVNDDYGLDGAKAFHETFERRGGKWLGEETFNQKDIDIRSQATKIASLKPEVVLVVGRDQSLGLAIKQLHEAGFKGQLMSVNCLDQPKVWEIAGLAVNNALFASASVDFQGNPNAREFREKFVAKYKTEPDYVAVYGYTIVKYLAPILRESGGDRERIRTSLEKLDVASMRGQLKMDSNREVMSPVAVYRVIQNRKQMIETPDQLTGL